MRRTRGLGGELAGRQASEALGGERGVLVWCRKVVDELPGRSWVRRWLVHMGGGVKYRIACFWTAPGLEYPNLAQGEGGSVASRSWYRGRVKVRLCV